jgi:phosphatidylglycerol lysyltransferase
LLVYSRKTFTVRSSIPDLRWGIIRLMAALVAALAYGIAGFWLLDPREFGINFSLGDAIQRTLLFLSLVGDPGVVPRTQYARWFLSSIYLVTGSAVAYSIFAIFRPVVYRFRTLPHERKQAQRIVEIHGRSAIDFFKSWPDKAFYFSASERCFLAYRVGAGCAIALGDPVGPEEEIEPTVRGFGEMCDQNDWRVALHQTLPDFLPVYKKLGYRKLKVGDDAIVELTQFKLEGKRAKKFRYVISLMDHEGMKFILHSPPLPVDILSAAKEVSDSWLRIPGRRERAFSLGRFDAEYVQATPIAAVANPAGVMLAFANIIPSFRRGEATIDLMRHRVDAPNGIMDFLLVKLLLAKKEEGFSRFNLGMAPMAGFREWEPASIEERAIHEFMQHLSFIFRFQGLRAHKAKFASTWEPRYLVYKNMLNLPLIARTLADVSEIHE